MSDPSIALLLLRDGPPDAAAEAATLASVRDELPAGAPVLTDPREAVGAADVVALARPGDRWIPGAFAARLGPLLARPDQVLSLAAYALVDASGDVVATVRPPFPPLDAAELLLRPTVEPSAVLVRGGVLDEGAASLLARPHGDAVLWSRLTAAHGLLPTAEMAAHVPLQPGRHGVDAERSTAVLLEALAGPEAQGPGATTMRRELLRRLYLDGDPEAEPASVDLSLLLDGDPAHAAAVFEDLQWALERQREALLAERLPWARGVVGADDALDDPGPDIVAAQHDIHRLHREVAVRDTRIARLHAELVLRDTALAAGAETAQEEPVP